jgi:O-Antigen ligase
MSENLRALIVVLALGVPAFYIGGQIAGPFVSRREFAVWRNAWFAVALAAFLSINFLAFGLFVTMICLYARSARAATIGMFFVLLFGAPLVDVPIGGIGGINSLLPINNGRLLTIFLLLPILFAKSRTGDQKSRAFVAADWLVVGYALLMMGLEFRRSELTNVMRAGVLYTLDILIPYFAFSRAVSNISDFRKVLFGFVIAVLPLSLIALIETAKGWHLYAVVSEDWGAAFQYTRRDGLLRAAGPAPNGGAIVLGYLMMVAIGCELAVWQGSNAWRRYARIALIFFLVGLIASLSRGPWVGAMILVTAFVAMGPHAVVRLGRLAVGSVLVLVPLLLMPAGQKLINMLPFIGSAEVETVAYRQRLFENAFIVIERNLWIGSADYLSTPEMQAMVQGEGIIDTVNTYVVVALNSGMVGLSLFLGFFAAILIGLWRVAKYDAYQKLGLGNCARALAATLLGILVTIGTVSSVDFIPYVYWSFAGLCVAFVRIAFKQRAVMARGHYAGLSEGGVRFARDQTD